MYFLEKSEGVTQMETPIGFKNFALREKKMENVKNRYIFIHITHTTCSKTLWIKEGRERCNICSCMYSSAWCKLYWEQNFLTTLENVISQIFQKHFKNLQVLALASHCRSISYLNFCQTQPLWYYLSKKPLEEIHIR